MGIFFVFAMKLGFFFVSVRLRGGGAGGAAVFGRRPALGRAADGRVPLRPRGRRDPRPALRQRVLPGQPPRRPVADARTAHRPTGPHPVFFCFLFFFGYCQTMKPNSLRLQPNSSASHFCQSYVDDNSFTPMPLAIAVANRKRSRASSRATVSRSASSGRAIWRPISASNSRPTPKASPAASGEASGRQKTLPNDLVFLLKIQLRTHFVSCSGWWRQECESGSSYKLNSKYQWFDWNGQLEFYLISMKVLLGHLRHHAGGGSHQQKVGKSNIPFIQIRVA